MAIIKLLGAEQTIVTPNTFSSANSTQVMGWNLVRCLNTGTSAKVLTINTNSVVTNCSILPSSEVIIKKSANATIAATDANVVAVAIAYEST